MRIADALHRAARRLRAIVDRLRRRSLIYAAAGLGLAACDRSGRPLPRPIAMAEPAPVHTAVAPAPPPAEQPIGHFQMTFYFIIHEAEMAPAKPANDPTPTAANDPATAAANDNIEHRMAA